MEKLRVPGSVRDEGRATLAVSVPTREKIKQLAGDMPVSEFIKRITEEVEQPALPGQGKSASQNTIAAVKTEIRQLQATVNTIAALMMVLPFSIPDPLGIPEATQNTADSLQYVEGVVVERLRSMPAAIRDAVIPRVVEILNSVKSNEGGTQPELKPV